MAARASFSRDSRTVSMPLPNSILLKDYLVDDLSSCSSNGFRSYPRQPCCTKVRYLIEIDLSIKLPPSRKQFLKVNSKPKPKPKHNSNPDCSKSKMNLRFHKASKAVVNVFKKFHFSGSGSGSGNRTKPKPKPKHNFLHFWKQTRSMNRSIDSFERLNSFKRNDNINTNSNNIFTTLNTTATTAEMKASGSNSNSNSNSFTSSDSYFTATTNSTTTGGCSNIIVAQNDVVKSEQLAPEKMNTEAVTVVTASNAKKKLQGEERDIFSPISVIDFPYDRDNDDEEDEVTSPYQQQSPFYAKGCKRKLMSKPQRTKSLVRLNPVRLEDRITLSESQTRGSILESSLEIQRELAAEKNAIALLQLLKATMSSHDLSKSPMTERVLLGFFTEQFIQGSVSNYVVLQEAKDWINGQTKDILEYQYNKLAYIKEMEKEVKWLEYNEEETREVVSELEYQVFTSLVEEMFLEFYL
ncbi:hypothetical protein HanRHA438_Chr06g0249191 [Helianthus annuus]|uniref:uncharacterized protein LOC110864352 n=1 Tax=Helianthus annuus TaxID=4232 RepID=UPI000B8FA23D|nr:uncharacterized protein LOC110864352 [Helianthus annuus]KAJ0572061.1 hypothetical protein HanHA89_Chr06g0211651 [Helianthus annuus]KAJ0910153.1 hypothetical protein HanRHA438_Chr06g0249191 [Helianthus annuus]